MKQQLIEQILEYGTPHESVMDDILNETEDELRFRLWRLENDWERWLSDDTFINTTTLAVICKETLRMRYEVSKNLKTIKIIQS